MSALHIIFVIAFWSGVGVIAARTLLKLEDRA